MSLNLRVSSLYSVLTSDNLTNCYGNGTIIGATSEYGGFLGNTSGHTSYTYTYYNSTKAPSNHAQTDVTPLTSEQMGVYTNFKGWDFRDGLGIWKRKTGSYPVLRKFGGEFIGDICDS